mgnify:CR=1 FL=1
MYVFTWNFWRDAISRIVRTFCQTLASTLGGSALNIWQISGWTSAIGISLGASLVSFLMCVDRAFAITEVKYVEPDQVKGNAEAS